jgi:hypothetical protein
MAISLLFWRPFCSALATNFWPLVSRLTSFLRSRSCNFVTDRFFLNMVTHVRPNPANKAQILIHFVGGHTLLVPSDRRKILLTLPARV